MKTLVKTIVLTLVLSSCIGLTYASQQTSPHILSITKEDLDWIPGASWSGVVEVHFDESSSRSSQIESMDIGLWDVQIHESRNLISFFPWEKIIGLTFFVHDPTVLEPLTDQALWSVKWPETSSWPSDPPSLRYFIEGKGKGLFKVIEAFRTPQFLILLSKIDLLGGGEETEVRIIRYSAIDWFEIIDALPVTFHPPSDN